MIYLAIDFDNTIANISSYPKIDSLRIGAKKYINKLYNSGKYYIIINTCRTNRITGEGDANMAIEFLEEQNIKYHKFNKNAPELIETFSSDSRKISADIYIDNKGLWLFPFPSWFFLYYMIKIKTYFLKTPLKTHIK